MVYLRRVIVTHLWLWIHLRCALAADTTTAPNQTEASDTTTPCDLDCVNDGVCEIGRTGSSGSSSQVKGHWCRCPTGYSGVVCEIAWNVCVDDTDAGTTAAQGTCYNGDTCLRDVDDRGNSFYHCECDPARSDLRSDYNRHFCAHASTTYCSSNRDRDYCVNMGGCLERASHDAHGGCDCPPNWGGDHCEVPLAGIGAMSLATNAGKSGGLARTAKLVVALCTLVAMAAFVALLVDHGRVRERRRARQQELREQELARKRRAELVEDDGVDEDVEAELQMGYGDAQVL